MLKLKNINYKFDYERAFSRNLGIVTEAEQQILRNARIGLSGCGGAGGQHAMTLARMGVGNFTISDFDKFALENFNRQSGARISTIDQNKVDVISNDILDINPEANIKVMPKGLSEENLDEFFNGLDLIVDSIDFFAMKMRALIFREARRRGITVITAGPLGFSSALLIFTPDSMSLDDYFGFKPDDSEELMAIKFHIGLAPKGLHWGYIISGYVNFKERRGPSIGTAIALCAAWAGTNCAKVLLNRGQILSAPHYMQFDMYRNKFVVGRNWLGAKNPIFQLKLFISKKMHLSKSKGV